LASFAATLKRRRGVGLGRIAKEQVVNLGRGIPGADQNVWTAVIVEVAHGRADRTVRTVKEYEGTRRSVYSSPGTRLQPRA